MTWDKKTMCEKVITFFKPGQSVNLGIGMPTMIAELIPDDLEMWIHSENGVLGVKGRPEKGKASPTLINAGKETISIKDGASFFHSALSFGMIRGGHLDHCVLGGMEVDFSGNLANWMVPGKKVTGMGGAMDLVNGAKNVIVMMTHFNKLKKAKMVASCQLPLTGKNVVHYIVTDYGIFKPTGSSFDILELATGVKKEDLGF